MTSGVQALELMMPYELFPRFPELFPLVPEKWYNGARRRPGLGYPQNEGVLRRATGHQTWSRRRNRQVSSIAEIIGEQPLRRDECPDIPSHRHRPGDRTSLISKHLPVPVDLNNPVRSYAKEPPRAVLGPEPELAGEGHIPHDRP